MPRPLTRPRSDQELASPGPRHPRGVITSPQHVLPPGTPHEIWQALDEHLRASLDHTSQLAEIVRRLARGPGVLETATVTIPASGVFCQDRYKVPYAAVAILNASAAVLTVVSGAAQSAPPGGGQGQFTVPAAAFVAWNLTGSALSVYGAAGTLVCYTTFTDRIQPAASSI